MQEVSAKVVAGGLKLMMMQKITGAYVTFLCAKRND